MFRRYSQIIVTEWQRQLTYRLDFLGYRLAALLEIMAQIIIWTVLFQGNSVIKGYTYPEMITYTIIGWTIYLLSSNFNYEDTIAREIKDGTLSNFLIKPMSYLKYISARSLGRVSTSLATAIVAQIILIYFLIDYIIAPQSWLAIVIIMCMIILGLITRLLFAIIVGTIAFWTTETYGMSSALRVALNVLSGSFFPLDLLGPTVTRWFYCTPFIYTFFVPTQFYLQKITLQQALIGIGMQIIWNMALIGLITFIWRRGLKHYESVGI